MDKQEFSVDDFLEMSRSNGPHQPESKLEGRLYADAGSLSAPGNHILHSSIPQDHPIMDTEIDSVEFYDEGHGLLSTPKDY